MSETSPKRRFRLGRILKRLIIGLALVFFVALGAVLWAFQTGRAATFVREELLTDLERTCEIDAEFEGFELALFPPQAVLQNAALFDKSGQKLASVEQAILRIGVLPLFYGRLQFYRISVLAPETALIFDKGKLANMPACMASDGKSSSPIGALGVDDLRVERGRVRLVVSDSFEALLQDIDIALTPGEAGGSDLAVGFDNGRVDIGEQEIPIRKFRLLAHIAGLLNDPRAISVEQMQVETDGLTLGTSGEIDMLGPVVEAQVKLDTELSAINRLYAGLPAMKGKAKVDTRVVGTMIAPRAQGTIEIENGQIDTYALGDKTKVGFRANMSGLEVPELEIALGKGTIKGKGRVEFDEARRFPVRLDIDADRVQFGRVMDAIDVKGSWVEMLITGQATLEGHALAPFGIGGALDFSVRDMHVFDAGWDSKLARTKTGEINPEHLMLALGPTSIKGAWRADADALTFSENSISRGQTRGVVSARIEFAADGGVDIRGDLSQFDFTDLGPIAGLQLSGAGYAAGQVKGPYSDIRGIGTFELADTAVAGVPFGDGTGSVDWRGSTILVESIEGRLGKSSYEGDVRIVFDDGAKLGISGTIPRGRVQDLMIPFGWRPEDFGNPTGQVMGTFDLQGTVDALTGPLEFEVKNFEVIGEKMQTGRVIGRMQSGTLVAEGIELKKYKGRLSGSGWLVPATGEVRARVHTRNLHLQDIDMMQINQPKVDGRLAVQVDLRGNLKGLTGTVTAALAEMTAGNMTLGAGKFTGHVRGGEMFTTGKALDGKLDVKGKVAIDRALTYEADLRLTNFDAPQLVGELNDISLWTGSATGRASFKGSLVDWHLSRGEMLVERGVFEAPSLDIETAVPARFKVKDAVFETERLALKGPTSRIEASGKLGRRLMDLAVKGSIDLVIVQSMFEQIERSGGSLNLDAALRGSAKELDLLGTGRIENGMFQWRGIPSRLTGGVADLTFSHSTVLIQNAHGRVDGGEAKASGTVLLDGYSPSQVKLETELVEIRPRFVHPKFDLSGILNGKVHLEGRPDRLVMRGDLTAKRTLLRPKFDWRNIVGDPMRRLVPNVYDPENEILNFDIQVDLLEPMRLKNDQADLKMSGKLAMTGTNQRIGTVGTLTIIDGTANFLGRTYRFERGAVTLQDRYRFFPAYDLTMKARACAAEITINVIGTLDEVPKPTFTSKPEMDETDAFVCLTRGIRVRDVEGLSDEALSRAAAGVAGEALWRLSGVDQQVKKVIPIDQLDVTTEYSARNRLYEPRILIAKEIVDGKVRLEFSSSLFNTQDQRVTARYRVTPSLTLQSGWTSSEDISVGDLGLDLRYRWEW